MPADEHFIAEEKQHGPTEAKWLSLSTSKTFEEALATTRRNRRKASKAGADTTDQYRIRRVYTADLDQFHAQLTTSDPSCSDGRADVANSQLGLLWYFGRQGWTKP